MHLPGMKARISPLMTRSAEDESKSKGFVYIKHEKALIAGKKKCRL